MNDNPFMFCPIDAKVGNYMPIQLRDGDDGRPRSLHNSLILTQMNLEYLERLKDLQEALSIRYCGMLKPEPAKPEPDVDYRVVNSLIPDYEKRMDAVDDLWYS